MAGFIKISRDILDWEWYDDPNTFRMFIHLLLNANYEDKKYHGVDIRKGSLVIGRQQLAVDLGISEQNVRTALNHLKSCNEITIKSTSKFSIVTICNYERWQGTDFPTNQQTNQQINQQLTINQPATNQQLTTTKEIKKGRNEEYIIKPPIAPLGAGCENAKDDVLAGQPSVQDMLARQSELESENDELRRKLERAESARKSESELDLSIVSDELRPVVDDWLAYKRQKRQSYKPRGFVTFYNKLVKDCGGDASVAREMVEYSVANNYDGLFKPKDYRRYELPGQVMRGEEREYNENNFFER